MIATLKKLIVVIKSLLEAIKSLLVIYQPDPDSITYRWDTQYHNWHNVRVLCDKAGLSWQKKNIISACIYQESRFNNKAKNRNKNANGKVWSTDWGIVQVNDYWHIGKTKTFPSVKYVLDNPEMCVAWMIAEYKKGNLKQWSSYSTGAYKKWISKSSQMWKIIS